MNYEQLIKTVTAILNNEDIVKEGLVLTYYLEDIKHKKMNEELFYRINHPSEPFNPSDEFEVEVGGVLIKFFKK